MDQKQMKFAVAWATVLVKVRDLATVGDGEITLTSAEAKALIEGIQALRGRP